MLVLGAEVAGAVVPAAVVPDVVTPPELHPASPADKSINKTATCCHRACITPASPVAQAVISLNGAQRWLTALVFLPTGILLRVLHLAASPDLSSPLQLQQCAITIWRAGQKCQKTRNGRHRNTRTKVILICAAGQSLERQPGALAAASSASVPRPQRLLLVHS